MDIDLQPTTYTGLLVPEIPIGPKDFIKGAPTNPLGGLGYATLLESGDYTPYIPGPQPQSRPGVYDTDDCTGFGYCRRLATHLNCMWKLERLSDEFIAWAQASGYIQNGSFMFDPQVLGILAGTTASGNWIQKVADTARRNGLAPAGSLPGVGAYTNANDYYAEKIPDSVMELCAEFASWIDLPYQWIDVSEEQASLPAGPLYIAVTTCAGWNTADPIPWCNAGNASNHCVAEIKHQVILDSYNPYIKTLSADYGVPYAMQVLVTELKGKNMQTIGFQQVGNATVYVQVGANTLVAVADWQAFVNLGGSSNSVITLTADQFAKFTVASHDLFKSE